MDGLRASISDLDSGSTPEDVAAKVLDSVKIMRVFDFVGVREAVGEVRDGLEGRKTVVVEKPEEKAPVLKESEGSKERTRPKRTYVADSEDEDEEEDEEMLFESEGAVPIAAPAVQDAESTREDQPSPSKDISNPNSTENPTPSRVKFILIDNLAQVINPLFKKDYGQGTTSLLLFYNLSLTPNPAHTLLTTFLTTLTNLTQTHTLHTLLLNPTTTPRAPSPNRNQGPAAKRYPAPPSPSIFASNAAVPSLLGVLPRYVDVMLLVTQLPRRRMDARVFYSDIGSGGAGVKKRGVEMLGVMEVVADRWEGRVGGWGAFQEREGVVRDVS